MGSIQIEIPQFLRNSSNRKHWRESPPATKATPCRAQCLTDCPITLKPSLAAETQLQVRRGRWTDRTLQAMVIPKVEKQLQTRSHLCFCFTEQLAFSSVSSTENCSRSVFFRKSTVLLIQHSKWSVILSWLIINADALLVTHRSHLAFLRALTNPMILIQAFTHFQSVT